MCSRVERRGFMPPFTTSTWDLLNPTSEARPRARDGRHATQREGEGRSARRTFTLPRSQR
jgi:hypothetical protein